MEHALDERDEAPHDDLYVCVRDEPVPGDEHRWDAVQCDSRASEHRGARVHSGEKRAPRLRLPLGQHARLLERINRPALSDPLRERTVRKRQRRTTPDRHPARL